MSSSAGRQRLHRWGSVAVMASAVLLAPQIASATIGDSIGDPVNAVTGTVDDATGQVTGTANDATGQVTGTANDATGQVTGTANDTTGSSSSQETRSGSTDPTGQGSVDRSTSHDGPSASGSRGWAALRASVASSMLGGRLDLRSDDEVTQRDPCEPDQILVCLDTPSELGDFTGDFADVGARVIASLAQTGVGVLGLAALTLLLAIAGSSAVAASSRRMESVVLRAD